MKSKKSCFDRNIFAASLRRSWPLWIAYLIALGFCLPLMFGYESYPEWAEMVAEGRLIGDRWVYLTVIVALASVLSVMLAFGHLYSPRQTSLFASLPVKRGTVFTSCFWAGLLPLLASELVIVLVCAAVEAAGGVLNVSILLVLLLCLVLLTLCFYGFAVFCAMLTGNIVILPLVFLVLEVTAFAVLFMAHRILTALLFGWFLSRGVSGVLSPLVWIATHEPVVGPFGAGEGTFGVVMWKSIAGMGAYAVVGVLFSVAALILYKRRAAETVGEIVALPVLRPVFRWCMALGCGVSFAFVFCVLRGGGFFYCGTAGNAAAAAVLSALGAFAGWFGAQMLMKKTVRVFGAGWLGGCIAAVLLAVGIVAVGTGGLGYEERIPESETVQSVAVSCGGYGFFAYADDSETVLLAREAQRALIDGRADHARAGSAKLPCRSTWVYFTWLTDDDRLIQRSYLIYDPAVWPAMEDETALLEALLSSPEAVDAQRLELPLPANTELNCFVYMSIPQTSNEYRSEMLGQDDALSLYGAVERDLDAGSLGLAAIFPRYENDTAIRLMFELYEINTDPNGLGMYSGVQTYVFDVTDESENTLAWLRENTVLG